MNLVSRYSISEALGAIINTILDVNCEIFAGELSNEDVMLEIKMKRELWLKV